MQRTPSAQRVAEREGKAAGSSPPARIEKHPHTTARCALLSLPLEQVEEVAPQVVPDAAHALLHAVEGPHEEGLHLVVVAVAEEAEGRFARGPETASRERIAGRDAGHVDARETLAEVRVDGVDEDVGDERVAGVRRMDAIEAEDAAQV